MCRLERFAGIPRDQLTIDDVSRFLRSDAAPRTKELTFCVYRLFHRWGALAGYWHLNPELIEMKFPKAHPSPQPSLSMQEARALISQATSSTEVRLVFLGLYAGLRLGAIVAVDQTAWTGSLLTVPAKGGDFYRLPVHPELDKRREEILAEMPTRRMVQSCCRNMQSWIGGVPLTPHWLRRTFSDTLRTRGVDRAVIGALLGHAASGVTEQHYAPVRWPEMAEGMKRLRYQQGRGR